MVCGLDGWSDLSLLSEMSLLIFDRRERLWLFLAAVPISSLCAQSNFTGADLDHDNDWFTSANWDPSGVPTRSTDVTINTVGLSVSGAINVMEAANFKIGSTTNGAANFYIENGATLTTGSAELGQGDSSYGFVILGHASSWVVNGTLNLGAIGGGRVELNNSLLTSGTVTQGTGGYMDAHGSSALLAITGDYIADGGGFNHTEGACHHHDRQCHLGRSDGGTVAVRLFRYGRELEGRRDILRRWGRRGEFCHVGWYFDDRQCDDRRPWKRLA